MIKNFTEKDLFPPLDDFVSRKRIDKEYTERKKELPLWDGDAIYIEDRMNEYLAYIKLPENYNIDDAETRSLLLLDTDIDNDPIIVDYLSSQAFINTHLKNSKSGFKEPIYCYPTSYLSSYIVHPSRKLYGILTAEQQKNRGRKLEQRKAITYDEQGNEIVHIKNVKGSYKRSTPVAQVYKNDKIGNYIKSGGKKKIVHTDNLRYTSLHSVDLSNPHHIKKLLEGYYHWKEMTQEQGNISDEFNDLLNQLDELIKSANFSPPDLLLISLLKRKEFDKLTYKKILSIINSDKNINNITYKQLTDKSSKSIPFKIAKAFVKSNNT